MPTQKQRRDAARRHLERQLQRRAEQEAARKRFALIASVIGTLVVIAIIVTVIVMTTGGSDKPNASGKGSTTPTGSPSSSTSPTAAASACPTGTAPVPVAKGTGPLTTFDGVTVRNGADMAREPTVGSKATKPPAKLEYKDLVVGKGKAATPTSTVAVKYIGVLYCDGTLFDASSKHGGTPISFSLTGVVPGFTQGIGGTTGVPPMKVGGRRIIIMPSSLGYGAQANGGIPANAPLVFVVDLTKVS